MAIGDDSLALLRSIDRRLALLTRAQERDLRARFQTEILRTSTRTAMWEAIDGKTGTTGLARAAGASDRLAQMFVKELRESGFVYEVADGRVAQDLDRVLEWYLATEPSP